MPSTYDKDLIWQPKRSQALPTPKIVNANGTAAQGTANQKAGNYNIAEGWKPYGSQEYPLPKIVTPTGTAAQGQGTASQSAGTEAEQAAADQNAGNAGTPANAGDNGISDAVLAARQYLDQQLQQRPGAYGSRYNDQLENVLAQIQGREAFRYDANADPLYQMYRDIYMQNSQRAMQDTMGQAAALTGGYGNSYAQMAGQQQYNQNMEGLNAMVPQLQQQAYQQYQNEGDALMQNYQMLAALENQALQYAQLQEEQRQFDAKQALDQAQFDLVLQQYEDQKRQSQLASQQAAAKKAAEEKAAEEAKQKTKSDILTAMWNGYSTGANKTNGNRSLTKEEQDQLSLENTLKMYQQKGK